jgi:hypothetical protein
VAYFEMASGPNSASTHDIIGPGSPRLLMPPALFVEFDTRTSRRSRGIIEVARVAARARHSGDSTAAGVVAIPSFVRVVFAHPGTALAEIARYERLRFS